MKQIITALAVAFLALWVAAAHAQEANLRTAVIVEGDYVTLGDLFDNAGVNAAKKVAYAPAPGKRATFDAKWLYKVSQAYKLNWRPFNLATHAVVERSSQVIQRDEIHDALLRALRARGAGEDIEVELTSNNSSFYVAADKAASVGVDNLNYDPGTGRFVATVAVPANDPAASRTRVTGRIHKLVSIPVLTEGKRRGEVIHASDIQWRDVRASEVRNHVVTDDDELIGMAAKREIKPASAVDVSQIRRPLLVTKGDLVTIEMQNGGMSLSTQGKALDEGSMGDVIKVTNIRSNKIVEARVNGANKVEVSVNRADANARTSRATN